MPNTNVIVSCQPQEALREKKIAIACSACVFTLSSLLKCSVCSLKMVQKLGVGRRTLHTLTLNAVMVT